MSNEMQLKLIETYSMVCDLFDKNPQWNFIRLSNNNTPAQFTDQEVVTIYLFVGYYQKYSKIKEIHDFTRHYLLNWFPNLTSYEKFNNRLNILNQIFYDISLDIISNNIPVNAQFQTQMIDSLPIVTCKQRNRTAKVARECVDKGFCSTKKMYYYGLKFHLLAFRRNSMTGLTIIFFPLLFLKFDKRLNRFLIGLSKIRISKTPLKFRSKNGLCLHCFGKLAIACLIFLF